jgi:hypothetical protein
MPNLGHYDRHGGYTNQAIIIGKKIKTTQAGNMSTWEVECSRGSEWFEGGELEPDDRGVNAAGICFEMLCNDVTWMGAQESFLHQASFESVRDKIADYPISPLITEQAEAQALLARLFEYHDLFGRPHQDTWQFELGIWEHGDIDVDALPVIDSDDLTEEPELVGELWADTINYVRVRYSDREHLFKEKLSEPASDPNNFRIVGEKRAVELSREWCTDNAFANYIASVYLGINAQPKIPGSIRVKRESVDAKNLWPGKLAMLNVASDGRSYVIRLLNMDWPAANKGDVGFTIENERGIWPRRYTQPPIPFPGDFIVDPAEIKNERILELPSGELKTSGEIQIAVLAQRPSDKMAGFAVHCGLDEDAFDLVAPHNHFAAYGKIVDVAYPDSTDTLDTTVGFHVELFGVDKINAQTDTQRNDRTVLIVINNEIMSEGLVEPLGAGKFKVFSLRALYGTEKQTHAIGDEVFFIERAKIVPIENRNFAPGATRWFKLQAYTATQEYDLALVDPFSYTFHAGPPLGSIFDLALTSDAKVDSAGVLEALIYARWSYLEDQDINLFALAYRRTPGEVIETPSEVWIYRTVDPIDNNSAGYDFRVTPFQSYDVKVRPINRFGTAGEWSDIETIVSGAIDLFSITGLELAGQGADHNLYGRDAHLACRLNSPSQGTSIEGGPNGISGGIFDPLYIEFEWKIYEGALTLSQINAGEISPGVPIVRLDRESSTQPNWDWNLDRNIAAVLRTHPGAPALGCPLFTVWCGAHDKFNRAAAPAIIVVPKAPPTVGSNLLMNSASGAMDLSWLNPNVEAIDYIEININGILLGNIRRVPFPGTTHHVIPLINGLSYKFQLRWFDKFGLASSYLESDWSPVVGGFVGVELVDFSRESGPIIDGDTVAVTSRNPGAEIYYRGDANPAGPSDIHYTVPIIITGGNITITAAAVLNGVTGPSLTRNFATYTPGGGGGDPPPTRPDPPFFLPNNNSPEGPNYGGVFNTGSHDFLDVYLASIQDGTWNIFYTIAQGIFGVPADPTHSGGTPTGATIKVTSPTDHKTIRVTDPTDNRFHIKALVWKPGADTEDSIIVHGVYSIIHS